MDVYTIFDRPEDHPACFVVRRFEIGPGWARPRAIVALAASLEAARAAIPPGLVRLARDPSDPPSVVETWL